MHQNQYIAPTHSTLFKLTCGFAQFPKFPLMVPFDSDFTSSRQLMSHLKIYRKSASSWMAFWIICKLIENIYFFLFQRSKVFQFWTTENYGLRLFSSFPVTSHLVPVKDDRKLAQTYKASLSVQIKKRNRMKNKTLFWERLSVVVHH